MTEFLLKDLEPFAEGFEFEIFAPDDMLCLISERRPDAISAALKKQCVYWSGRPDSKTLPEALIGAGAPNFAACIKTLLSSLALSGKY